MLGKGGVSKCLSFLKQVLILSWECPTVSVQGVPSNMILAVFTDGLAIAIFFAFRERFLYTITVTENWPGSQDTWIGNIENVFWEHGSLVRATTANYSIE